MNIEEIYPATGIYPPTSDYVHGMLVTDARRMLLVSGTMGLDTGGQAPAELGAQLDLIWNNIRAILAEAGMSVDNVVRVTSYLTRAAYAQTNAAARIEALNGRRVPTTAIVVQTLDPTWLVEIEVIATGA